MIELEKRGVLKITVCSVFICVFILALVYPLISARYNGKIHFLMSPNPHAGYSVPPGKEADILIVWVAVVKDSTYGRFTLALVAYETYFVDHSHLEYHFYTDNLRAGETYAYLWEKTIPPTDVMEYDVSVAKIDVAVSEHELNATVIVRGKMLFTVEFWAEIGVPIESRTQTVETLSQEVYLSVEAYRPMLRASVTGIEVGDFIVGHFDYVDIELYGSSLLP